MLKPQAYDSELLIVEDSFAVATLKRLFKK